MNLPILNFCSVLTIFLLVKSKASLEFRPQNSLTLEKAEQMYLEEYNQFEKDLEEGRFSDNSHPKERTKRFVIFNTKTHFDVALLLGIPMTAFLPVLSNKFNGRRRRRYVDSREAFQDHPVVQPHLDKVESYFNLVNIPDRSCQLRAVCEFSSEPEQYYPISDLVLTKIRNPTLHATVAEEDNFSPPFIYSDGQVSSNITEGSGRREDESLVSSSTKKPVRAQSLFSAYNKAADYGQAYGQNSCSEMFSEKCKYSMKQLLNMPALHYWNVLSTLLKFSLREVTK